AQCRRPQAPACRDRARPQRPGPPRAPPADLEHPVDLYEQLAAVPTMPPTVPAVAAAAAAVTLAFLLTVVRWSTGHRVHGHDVAVSLAVAVVVGLATLGCAWSVHND